MPIALGIIGLGYTGRQQFRAAAEVGALRIVAGAETKPPQASDLARLRLYDDWRRMLRDEPLDAVSICLPHALHAEVAIAALEAGKHVLIEKPIAGTLAEARRIVEAAEAAGRVLMVEMTHRFYPPVLAAREAVRAGRLGRLLAVEDRVMERFVGSLAPWMLRKDLAQGGVALTDGIHMLDRVAFASGQPLKLLAGTVSWAQAMGDVEDTAAMHLRLADGTPVNLLASWCNKGAGLDDELTFYGTDATLRVWAWRGWRIEPAEGPAEDHAGYPADQEFFARVRVGMRGALSEFAAAIREGREPSPAPREILAAQAIIERFYKMVSRQEEE